MKIFRHIVALLSVVLTVLPSCSKVEPKDVVFEEKEKTLLLYFASHNNLYMDAASNISKIIKGYVPSDGNIVLYCNNFDLSTKQMKDTLPLLVNISRNKKGDVQIDTIYKFPYINSCTKNQMKSLHLLEEWILMPIWLSLSEANSGWKCPSLIFRRLWGRHISISSRWMPASWEVWRLHTNSRITATIS